MQQIITIMTLTNVYKDCFRDNLISYILKYLANKYIVSKPKILEPLFILNCNIDATKKYNITATMNLNCFFCQ